MFCSFSSSSRSTSCCNCPQDQSTGQAGRGGEQPFIFCQHQPPAPPSIKAGFALLPSPLTEQPGARDPPELLPPALPPRAQEGPYSSPGFDSGASQVHSRGLPLLLWDLQPLPERDDPGAQLRAHGLVQGPPPFQLWGGEQGSAQPWALLRPQSHTPGTGDLLQPPEKGVLTHSRAKN